MFSSFASIILFYGLGFAMARALGRRYSASTLEIVFFGFVCSTGHALVLPVAWALSPYAFVLATLASAAVSTSLAKGCAPPAIQPLPPLSLTAVILVLAALLRLHNLGLPEFQGDEVRALRAASRLSNDGLEVLMSHKKGPAEILLPAIPVMLGERSEFLIRLPFALAGVGVVVGVLLLGVHFFTPLAGALAALIISLDGFGIAFSRIVQYQSVVLLFSIASVYLAIARRALTGSALCAALASLAHYDFVFCLPPIVFAVAWYCFDERAEARRILPEIAKASAVFAIVAGSFYVPFVTHPHFRRTLAYVRETRIGNSVLYNNLGDFLTRASIYNASFFIIAVLLLAGVSLIFTAPGARRITAAICAILLIATTIAAPGLWNVHGMRLTLVPYVTIALFALDAGRPLAWRCCLLWFLGAFIAGAYLVEKPVTHFYPMVPPLALLAASGSVLLFGALRHRARSAVGAAAGALIVLSLYHQYVVFLRPVPEYWSEYPGAKIRWYWTPFDRLPRSGYFGFPYRFGWRTVRNLIQEGKIPLDGLRTNADNTALWYLPESVRAVSPKTYIFFQKPRTKRPDIADLERLHGPLRSTLVIAGRPKGYIFSPAALELPAVVPAW